MSSFLSFLNGLSAAYFDSITHRVLLFTNLCVSNIFVKIPGDETIDCDFLLVAVPTGCVEMQDLSQQQNFIHGNMRLDYVF